MKYYFKNYFVMRIIENFKNYFFFTRIIEKEKSKKKKLQIIKIHLTSILKEQKNEKERKRRSKEASMTTAEHHGVSLQSAILEI